MEVLRTFLTTTGALVIGLAAHVVFWLCVAGVVDGLLHGF